MPSRRRPETTVDECGRTAHPPTASQPRPAPQLVEEQSRSPTARLREAHSIPLLAHRGVENRSSFITVKTRHITATAPLRCVLVAEVDRGLKLEFSSSPVDQRPRAVDREATRRRLAVELQTRMSLRARDILAAIPSQGCGSTRSLVMFRPSGLGRRITLDGPPDLAEYSLGAAFLKTSRPWRNSSSKPSRRPEVESPRSACGSPRR